MDHQYSSRTRPAPRIKGSDQPAGTLSHAPRLARMIVSAPDRLVLVLFWTCLVVAVTVLASAFSPWIVVPMLTLTLVGTWRLMPGAVKTTRASVVGGLAALTLALGWVVLNLPFASRYVTVPRDPGFLTLEALWLSKHPSPDIPMGSALAIQESIPGVLASTSAYFPADGMLHAQGAKLLPGVLALGGWVGGDLGVLASNLVIGAFALLALYGLARRVVGPLWALLPVVALAGSVPLAAFSRSAYTEPLTLALIFGGLTMAWSAFETGTWWRHAMAGALIGASALVRIDGGASVIGLIGGVGLAAAAPLGLRPRRRIRMALVAVMCTALTMVGIGFLDLSLHSPGYLSDLGRPFGLLTAALVATVVVSLALALPRFWDPVRRWVLRHRKRLSVAAMSTVALLAATLISRPLWLVERHIALGSGSDRFVEGLQRSEGWAVDPTRSYDELSVTWLSSYYGWPMVVLAFAGFALIARSAIRYRDPRHLVLLTVIAAPSALYLWRVSITPDLVWAMRRFLPVTIPGFLLTATVAIVALWSSRRWWARLGAGMLAATVAILPVFAWGSLFSTAEQGGRWAEIQAVCATIQGDHVLYVRGSVPGYLATLRSVCDVEVVEVQHVPTTQDLTAIRKAWGDKDLSVVAFGADALPWPDGEAPPPLKTSSITLWSNSLVNIPKEPNAQMSSVWVGVIKQDGVIVPVAPVNQG
jgi:hypothetical protein